ncbi:MAG: hypothetical protein V4633_07110 [Pseudomonadota bacterium]
MLYDPASRGWLSLAPIAATRGAPSLTMLADGRVWAAGGKGAATSSELWDPVRRQWQAGPALPVPMERHQALWVPGQDAVLLGAGSFPTVLSWKPGSAQVSIAAQTSYARVGGALVALSVARLGLVSGRGARGATVVPWNDADKAVRLGTWQQAKKTGLSVRAGRLLAMGGTPGGEDGSPTGLAELQDLGTGVITTLPSLAPDLGRAQVAWFDDRQAMIHGEHGHRGETRVLAVLDTVTGVYKRLDAAFLGMHVRVKLLGADAKGAWMAGEDAAPYRVDAATGRTTAAPRMQRKRSDFIGRVLADGKLLVAGGQVEAEMVASRPADCMDCQVQYVGWGAPLRSRRHEMFDPATQIWTLSAPARTAGGMVTIFADGRLAKAGSLADPQKPLENTRVIVELSAANGATWRTLSWPDGVPPFSGDSLVRVLAPLEGSSMPDALFLGIPDDSGSNTSWWWLPSVDASPLTWRKLGDAAYPYTFPRGDIALGTGAYAVGSASGVVIYGKP